MNVNDYSPIEPSVMDDPFPAYAALRERCPVHRSEALGPPMYSLSRAADVHAALVDHDLWSNQQGPGVQHSTGSVGDMQHDDRPTHTKRRLFVRDWFRPDAVARLEPSIREITVHQIESMPRDGADLYGDLALPLPVTSFCEVMGVDIDDRERFLDWADELVTSMAYPDRGADARRQLNAFTSHEVRERRAAHIRGHDVRPGLLSYLATEPYFDHDEIPADADTEGFDPRLMPVKEVVSMSNQLLIAGHETTASLITNCFWRLLEQPADRWERLVAEPELIANVIEESLRFDPPVLGLCRTNNRDTTVRDVDITENSKVMMLYASANRDPERFDRADEFLIDRPLRDLARHYSFSWGVHHCLGAHLARLTARVVLEEMVTRRPTLAMAGEPTRVASPFLWGRKTLPVTW